MKCPNCQHNNKEGAKFCGKCGGELSQVCPECGTENDSENNFCNECGKNLNVVSEPSSKELSFDEKLDKIQRYLPKGLTEKILSQRDRIEGERKQVTVMFCDLEGFTPLVEKLGPEEAYTVMDQVYEILIHKVHDYEGTVNEMTGDGILALVGAPIAGEDAPQRAIRSAYSIHKEIAKFNDETKQEIKGLPRLKMRIGIHTGPVVVGTVGNNLRVDFKAVGDTVNLASRMEGLAEPGATFVTEQTFRLTEGIFTYESLGEKKVKGKEEPVNVYRVIAPSKLRTRFDVSAERGLTPLVGRERELELLLDGFERAKQGRGQAFSIVAEAGVGKSRLLYEFIKAIANDDVTILEGKCLSFSRGVAYHPIIDLFRANFDINENDEEDQIRDKVKKGLQELKTDEASDLPYLLELLSVKESGIDEISMNPEARKEKIVETMTQIPMKVSGIRPLIMVIEDLHWIDKSSEEALMALLEKISGSRILLIFTYRPEFVHTWGGRSYHNQLNLNRLSNSGSLAMVNYLLGIENIERNLEDVILEKTEGIPLFIEEFVRSLKDIQAIEKKGNSYHLTKDIQDMTIPSTIQDVIMARVDSLPEAAKELLQRGAIIEREFSHELIKRVIDLGEQELLSHLSVLKDAELLFERGIYPECTYIFKHALTREVVYDSILTKRKMQLHEDIGQVIEKIYTERIEEFYEILAHHYSKSECHEKAHQYLKLAGNKAAKNYSNWEAFRFYKQAINVLSKLPETEENQREQIDVLLLIAASMFTLGYPENSLEILQQGEKLSEALGDEKSHAHFLSLMAQFHGFKGEDLLLGIKYSEDSLKEAEKIDDLELIAPIGMELCMAYWRVGECLKLNNVASKVITLIEKSERQHESFRRPYNVYSMLLAYYAASMGMLGKFEEGSILCEKGVKVASDLKDLLALGLLESCYGTLYVFKGDGKKAIEHLQNCMRYCEEIQLVALSSVIFLMLGKAYCLLGGIETAREYLNKGLKIQSDGKVSFVLDQLYGLSAMVYFESGDLKNAQHYAEEALKISQKVHQKWVEGNAWILLGRVFGKSGAPQADKAEECMLQGIKILDELKLKPLYAEGYHYLGELYADTDQPGKALENLEKATMLFQEMGMDYWLTKTQKVLERINSKRSFDELRINEQ
jgi:class 3 adenylate cyclase/tetratricopeptide (TPR) repeat protein